MKSRGIIFGAESVRAILAGEKTQTRRLVRKPPSPLARFYKQVLALFGWSDNTWLRCPYGVPGDRLWVRESYWLVDMPGYGDCPCLIYEQEQGAYERGEKREVTAGEDRDILVLDDVAALIPIRPWPGDSDPRFGHKSPLHMPRWASRLTLEVTDVRVQRLQEISEDDARAEGVQRYVNGHGFVSEDDCQVGPAYQLDGKFRFGFEMKWDEINGKRAPWASNPWVWALTFRCINP